MRKLSSFFNGADLEIDLHSERESVLASFEEFLRIEALGWKGKRKTALIQTDKHSDFARQTIEKLADKGQVRAATLKVEDRVLAVVIFLIEGDHAFAWKTAFDELYSGFSPGAILLHLAPEKLFQQDEIKLLDSLAHPQNKLINSLWSDRLSHAYLGYCRPRAAPLVHTILALFNVEKQLRKVAHALRPKPY